MGAKGRMNIQSLHEFGDSDVRKLRFHLACDLTRNKRPNRSGAEPEHGGHTCQSCGEGSCQWSAELRIYYQKANILDK